METTTLIRFTTGRPRAEFYPTKWLAFRASRSCYGHRGKMRACPIFNWPGVTSWLSRCHNVSALG